VVVLPFRQVTTSGSAMLALSAGRPLIVPDLPGLADLPDRAVLRYARTVPELSGALARLARADDDVLASMGAAAHEYATAISWRAIAEQTMTAILAATRDTRTASVPGDPVAAR
jgi:glycosyltransferase involved in cell wall biosynthesis